MNNYTVRIPICGYVELEIDANDEEQALETAFDKATLEDVGEWDLFYKVVEGNVFCGSINEPEVYENN